MRYTDYKQVRLLAKSILNDDKKMIALVEGLRGSLKQLKATFLDDGYDEVEAYANGLLQKLADAQESFIILAQELLLYSDLLGKAKSYSKTGMYYPALHGDAPGIASSLNIQDSALNNSAAATLGQSNSSTSWCSEKRMKAVHISRNGIKSITIDIGGVFYTYTCTKAGISEAYDQAVLSGDAEMVSRVSAMYEIETIRESLELNGGDPMYPQLGGYHIDVEKQDPAGYESHHIPARSVQAVDAKYLPTISISKDDHKLTSSYTGKQNRTYKPAFPTNIPSSQYRESIVSKIQQGGSGYIEAVRNELFDLRLQTGHRYDGGVSAYLDTVVDMLATSGIPEAKTSTGKR